jgi:beta-1,2-mannobiose phosphorylase / 1,2-beta-oligomannan phosphorylase
MLSLIFILLALSLLLFALFCLLHFGVHAPWKVELDRAPQNPVLSPIAGHRWESQAVFNPAAVYEGGRVHLFYRALGHDGISRVGYASSADGVRFDERLPYPVFEQSPAMSPKKSKKLSYKTLTYNTDLYASGGGWGGTEDPRAVVIDGHLYMSYSIFEGWQSMRLAVTSLPLPDMVSKIWKWAPQIYMSPVNQTNKNWVLFPEKINGKFAILHALTPKIYIEYLDALEDLHENPIQSNNHRTGRKGEWDEFVRGASAPPVKTPEGWLLLYHGTKPGEAVGYKVGAMLLDLKDPTKVLYRTSAPILEPTEWYENDWKPGVVYASGAVVMNGNLMVYYGGGDKYIASAKINLKDFLHKLMTAENKQ